MAKSGEALVTAIVIIVIIIAVGTWLVNISGRECKKDNECGEESYCGSDFACHQIPIIEKSPVVVERQYTVPAIIIGISMIVTAFIIKIDSFRKKTS
ncbi:MAG: hypothetical protein ABIF10_01160 [Candidatus Woesearchaeota archaeon]